MRIDPAAGLGDQGMAAIRPVAAASADHAIAGTGATGADKPAAAEAVTEARGFLFELVTAALYHRARVTFFAGLHRVGMFVNIMAGTAAVAFIRDDPRVSVALSLFLAFVTSANLAFDFAGLARKHEDARRTYHDLAADLEEGDASDATVKKLRARMIRTSADEPLVFEAAEKVAFNAAIRSMGLDRNDDWILTRTQRALRHLWPYSGHKFDQRKDGDR